MTLPPFLQRMNQRERILAGAVGGIVILLVNLMLWGWLLGTTRTLRAEFAKRKALRNEQIVYLRDADLWNKRSEWLRAHQPAYKGASDAPALLDELKQVAAKYNVLIENPAIGSGEGNQAFQSVFASIETKSPWPALIHFLYDVQAPESFTVFENATIAIDSTDASQIRGKFKIARWYSPAGRPNK